MNNLLQRVLTAVVLIAALLALIFKARSETFAAVMYGVGLLAVWELWRLVQAKNKTALWVMGCVYSAVAVQLWFAPSIAVLGAVGAFHGAVTLWVLRKKPQLQHWFAGVYGAALLACVVVSVTVLHSFGAWVLITAMVVVWAVDVGGYFVGKGLGGKLIQRGLAPTISPKKSWEGAIGGAVLAVVVTVACVLFSSTSAWMQVWVSKGITMGGFFIDHLASALFVQHPRILWVTLLIAAYSVTGDLVESLLKRQAGVKDSSHLLPGHGGILDRIDALIPVLPLCAAWAYVAGYRVL